MARQMHIPAHADAAVQMGLPLSGNCIRPGKANSVIKTEISGYPEDRQNWAETLAARAELENEGVDREHAMLAIMAVNRLLALSLNSGPALDEDAGQEFPDTDGEPATTSL